MNRRQILASAGGALFFSIPGCLRSGQLREDSDLPDEFTNEEYLHGFTPGALWSVSGNDVERSAHNKQTTLPSGDVDAAWLRWFENGPTRPITDDQYLYVGNSDAKNTAITALEAKTGTREWTETVAPLDLSEDDEGDLRSQVAGLAYRGERLYATINYRNDRGYEGQLIALTTDGEVRWREQLPAGVVTARSRGVLVTDDHLVVPLSDPSSSEGGVVVYDHDGEQQWRYALQDDEDVTDAPCIATGAVFLPSDSGRITAIEIDDGSTRWEAQVVQNDPKETGIRIQAPLSADEDRVYVPGVDDTLYVVSTTDGSVQWKRPETETNVEIAVMDDTIYLQDANGGITAVNADDGTDRWKSEHEVRFGIVAANNRIIGTDSTRTIALNSSGELQWEFRMQKGEAPGDAGYVMNPYPIVAHDMVYVWLADGRIYAIGARG